MTKDFQQQLQDSYNMEADDLEFCVSVLQHYIKSLRLEEIDHTGTGYWNIFCTNLEKAKRVKIIPSHYWEYLLSLEEKDKNGKS